ncbi:gliding motility-associated C-terminal domain-containing protein [Cytophaga hutchinsonii]|uniref:CHU large protein uncharacterized n=1 Tax=Cytophaga hutchinsonii (strain ATCC 33406 / DSM 1761 / CIP 103989 / NBRC 15051 / NCIMB 9469 / D465) TaxID=269798 RepID=A0A6N4SNH8_CYTH3|nr:gliding motility-associated C-terminal domain-containing protein [Cytophaga hutchinsonii]ABG57818.1 CHU large protein; uncharacterized [Cytophaga hutchinsonii ATCC 33406]SFX06389.1 gliding motility-associated C-terminal domain-containing protein [Cytophaga hutchinsonii ATCC 33406]
MNRTFYLFVKLSCIFSLFFFSILTFGQNTYYSKGNGNFNIPGNWSTDRYGMTGFEPTFGDLLGGNATCIIQSGHVIDLTQNITLKALGLESGSTFNISGFEVVITGDLEINKNNGTMSTINFGENTTTLTVNGNLIGGQGSSIQHAPIGFNTKQQLILKGASNTLHNFISTTNSIARSIVQYAGGNQTVFPSPNYSELVIDGTGIKSLTPSPFMASMETKVSKALSLNHLLQLNNQDLIYNGPNSGITYTSGWVYTNGTGMLKNISAEATQTFPVGDAVRMEAVEINNISNVSNIIYGVRYGAVNTSVNATIPNNGMGVWYISSNLAMTTGITLINPVNPAASLSATSKIAVYNNNFTSSWKTQATTYTTPDYKATFALQNSENSIALFDCRPISFTSSTLPPAYVGRAYNPPYLKVADGTAPYSLTSYSSTSVNFSAYVVSNTEGTVLIYGTPQTIATYEMTLKMSDAFTCETTLKYTIDVRKAETVWNGSSWSDGAPDQNMDAVFAGNYTAPAFNAVIAKSITVNAGFTVTVPDNSRIESKSTLTNNGTIAQSCNGNVVVTTGPIAGKPVTMPAITLSALPYGTLNKPYSQTITANITGTGASYSMIPLNAVPGISMTSGGIVSGTPTTGGSYSFSVTYSYAQCSYTQAYTLTIVEPASPNLYIYPINTKTYGDTDFQLSAYTKNTATSITYTVSPTGGCATLLPDNTLKITCAGPAPNNIITVTAKQAATGTYKAETVSTSFFINPAPAKLKIKNTGFLPNETIGISTDKTSDGVITYTQLSGYDVATVTNTGTITTYSGTGTFSVRIRIPATNNYTGLDSIYTFTVYPIKYAPIAVNDTIVLQIGQDSLFNILLNDYGLTDPINPTLTDIDIENNGIQNKYYSTAFGTFNIDPKGNLYIRTFEGFVGTEKLAYTVTDEYGLTSETAYLYITVEPPFKLPDLKANEVMTPNNDNLNDALIIAYTDLNKENSLTVMDKAGNTVYERTNYQNDWEGFDKNNNKLESGTYFYIFKEKYTGRQLSNYIQIVTQ